jgi:predicted DCC family thiol-disulfide oxidoreductase YuxK
VATSPEAVVVYDGMCGFCRYVVTALARRWSLAGRLQPWQSADLDALGLTEEDVHAKMWFVSDRRSGGASAFAAWLQTGDRGAARLGRALNAPIIAQIAAAVYSCVARYRRRIPGPWEKTCTL